MKALYAPLVGLALAMPAYAQSCYTEPVAQQYAQVQEEPQHSLAGTYVLGGIGALVCASTVLPKKKVVAVQKTVHELKLAA